MHFKLFLFKKLKQKTKTPSRLRKNRGGRAFGMLSFILCTSKRGWR